MFKLIEFIRRIHIVLLFIIIEAVALNYYASSSSYTQAKILSRANSVVGGLHRGVFSVKNFFIQAQIPGGEGLDHTPSMVPRLVALPHARRKNDRESGGEEQEQGLIGDRRTLRGVISGIRRL